MDIRVENLLAETLANWRAWIPQNYQSLNQVPQVLKKLQEGITNDSFLVTCADFKAVVRINCGYSSNLGINRSREMKIQNLLKDKPFIPQVLHANNEVQVREFIPGRSLELNDLASAKIKKLIEICLKDISTIDVTKYDKKNYQAYMENYVNQLEKPESQNIEETIRLAKLIDQADWRPIIAHNDLVPENIIYSGKQIYLIDWEYADFAHPFSDKLRLFGRNHFCNQKKGDILTALQVIQDNTDKLWLELRKKSYEH